MKKKGFTLVELLAVIAILAILVIIALPNIMDLFNQAKKNSFANEVKEIYKTAQAQWMSEALSGGGEKTYSRGANGEALSCTDGDLKLSGRTDVQYAVTINSSGEVVKIVATDGTFESYREDDLVTIDDAENAHPLSTRGYTGASVVCDQNESYGYKIQHSSN